MSAISNAIMAGYSQKYTTQTINCGSTTATVLSAAGTNTITVANTAGMNTSTTGAGKTIKMQTNENVGHTPNGYFQTTISSFNSSTGVVTLAANIPAGSEVPIGAVVKYDYNTTFNIPNSVLANGGVLTATYCGGGQGGAGGGSGVGSAAGGGGGASATFRDMPIHVNTSVSTPALFVVVGIGGAGGYVGSNGVAGSITKLNDNGLGTLLFPLPTGRGSQNSGSLAVAGGATNGGKGGDGGPLTTFPLIAATSTTGVEGGPLGGAGGTTGVNGGYGQATLKRGYSGTTGGAGGGGGANNSLGGSGGADEKHGDQANYTGDVASGGAGGGSFFGGAAYGGNPAGASLSLAAGTDSNGPGGGGGGGAGSAGSGLVAGYGGNGGDGVVIFSWYQ